MSSTNNIDESHWPPLIILAEVICHLAGIDQSYLLSLIIFVKLFVHTDKYW